MTQYNDLIEELQNKAEDEFGQQKRGVKIRYVDFDNNGPYVFYNENNLDDITFIDMMRRTRLSENKINKIIEFKRKVLPIKDSSIIKKNIKAKL